MTPKAKYKSDAFEAIHGAAQGLHRAGTIDKTTMREFDAACLAAPPAIDPERIKQLRERNHVTKSPLNALDNATTGA